MSDLIRLIFKNIYSLVSEKFEKNILETKTFSKVIQNYTTLHLSNFKLPKNSLVL